MRTLLFRVFRPARSRRNHAVRALAESYNDLARRSSQLCPQPGNIVFRPIRPRRLRDGDVRRARRDPGGILGRSCAFPVSRATSGCERQARRIARELFRAPRPRSAGMAERPLASWPWPLIALTSPERRLLVAPEYRELLRKRYDAEVFENAAPATIDAWAAARTRGKIPRVANWDSRSPPGFVLLNAIYFNGRWEQPFHEAATTPLPFAIQRGSASMSRRCGTRRIGITSKTTASRPSGCHIDPTRSAW